MRRSVYALALLPAALVAVPGVARAQSEDDLVIEVEEDLAIEVDSDAPTEVVDSEAAALRATVAALEVRLAALEAAEARPAAEPLPAPAKPTDRPAWFQALDLRVSGYVQAQYQASQISESEVTPDGAPINRDRFVVRRARLRVERWFTYAHAAVEIDANTVNGPYVSVRRAEVSGFVPNPNRDLPYAMLTLGLTRIPFGFELAQDQRERVFMERTAGSRALFPGEADVGAKLSGGVGPLRYALAVSNGVPIGDFATGGTEVFTKPKSFQGRIGASADNGTLSLGGGVSFLYGTGLHVGSSATKPSLSWSDSNQDGFVTLNELIGINGQAVKPSVPFERWGTDVDLQVGVRTSIGWTKVGGGATIATNLDRALYVADPVTLGYDVREFAWHAGITQEISPYAVVGFRADSYDPNADLFESRRGAFVPVDASLLTLSPVVGGQIPGVARLLFQYDHIVDHFGRDDRGEPVDLANDVWTLRAQVEF